MAPGHGRKAWPSGGGCAQKLGGRPRVEFLYRPGPKSWENIAVFGIGHMSIDLTSVYLSMYLPIYLSIYI